MMGMKRLLAMEWISSLDEDKMKEMDRKGALFNALEELKGNGGILGGGDPVVVKGRREDESLHVGTW